MLNSEETLLECFQEGFLVTPEDTEESFATRQALYRDLPKLDFKKSIFGIRSAHTNYSIKKMLLPWFAGLTKFDYLNDTPIPKVVVSTSAPPEVLDHELIHVVRAPFAESIFEEFLAFESSKGWRKSLGPLFFHAYEANSLAILLILCIFFPYLLLFVPFPAGYLLLRLKQTRSLYQKALQAICTTFSTITPLPYALLFTEEEFRWLAEGGGPALLKRINPLRAMQLQALRKLNPVS